MKIYELPPEVIELIKEFLPRHTLVFTNKTFYNLYHYTIRSYIPLYENFVRDTIRRDNDFVFEKVLGENFERWINNRQYRYKNMNFANYIYFIMHFCIENNSNRCREVLISYLSKCDLCKNLHKKNVVKYINGKIRY